MDKENNSTSSIGNIIDNLKELETTYKLLEEYTHSSITHKYSVKLDILHDILKYKIGDIETLPVETVKKFLKSYTDSHLLETLETKNDNDLYSEMKEIKKASLLLLSAKIELEELQNEANEALKPTSEMLNSKESIVKRIDLLKEDIADDNVNESKKKDINKVISALESTLDLGFFTKRIDTVGKKEIDSIVNGFLDQQLGSYVLKKYRSKTKRFKLSEDNFKHFMNIEETFLDEKYEPFNNLILFMYIRFVAYASPDDKQEQLFVHSLTSKLSDLMFHNFKTNEDENEFKTYLSSILDNFMEYRELFIENNSTYKKHAIRIQYDASQKEAKRNKAISECLKFDIKYDENLSTDELYDFVTDVVRNMELEQVEEFQDEISDNELADMVNSEDGELIYEPNA